MGDERRDSRTPNDRRNLLKTLACRYGLVTFPHFDTTIGKSLEFYGEWAQQEIELLWQLLPPGGHVIDVGAFIGTHTLAFARRVGTFGRVVAVEPSREVFGLLRRNVRQNGLDQVELLDLALGSGHGSLYFSDLDFENPGNFGANSGRKRPRGTMDGIEVPTTTLDDLELETLNLLKVDAEGGERHVLDGGAQTIQRLRPALYLECNTPESGRELLDWLRSSSYEVFCHRPRAFNPSNFFACDLSIFGQERERGLLALPEHRTLQFRSLLAETPDLRRVDGLSDMEFAEGEESLGEALPWGAESRFEIDAVNGIPLASLPRSSEGLPVVELGRVGFFATGWAVADGEFAGGVLIEAGGETVEADFGFPRRDLAVKRGDHRFLRSGFAFSLPPWVAEEGRLDLRITILSRDRSRGTSMPVLEFRLT